SRDVIDVIPRRQNMHGQSRFAGTLERLLRYGFRAPRNILEQTMMLRLQAKQIVAAVKVGPEHRPVSVLGKHLGGLARERAGQRGADGIETDRRAMAAF